MPMLAVRPVSFQEATMTRFEFRNRDIPRFLAIVLFAGASILYLDPGYGQIVTASLSGSVIDPAGAAIPEATVTVTNTQTGVVRQNSGRLENQ
jgi:hypothetical protein